MSLQLGNKSTKDDIYTIMINLIGAVPVLLLVGIYTLPPAQTFIYSIAVLLLVPTAIYDIVSKAEVKPAMAISALFGIVSTVSIFVLIFAYTPVAYSAAVTSSLVTAFLMHPVENAQERIEDVKARLGTPGYRNPIILKNTKFKSDVLAPLDLGVIGRDSFFRYLFSDYYTLKQSSHPLVFFTFVLTSGVQILVQQYPDPVFIIHLALALLATYIFSLGLKIILALMYSPDDVTKEIRERLELNLKRTRVQQTVRAPALYTTAFGLLLLLLTFGLPLPTETVPAGRFVNFGKPSTDFLLPLSIIPVIMVIYGLTRFWRATVWNKLPQIVRQEKKKKRRK